LNGSDNLEFNYELFRVAKNAAKDATLKMEQIESFVTKAKSVPLPSVLDVVAIHGLLDEVLKVKDNAKDINSMLDDWSSAIDEAYRIQSENEYNRLLGEYADVQGRLDEFGRTPVSGRVTEEQGKAMNDEARVMYDERNAIDKRLTELETILGVKRPNEYQWWDDLVAITEEIGTDVKDLCGDYGDMFSSIGTDAFADNFDSVVQGTIELDEKIDATTAQIGSDITRGVGNLVEKAVDFSIQAGSWLILNTGTTGVVFTVADLLGSDIKTTVEDWTKTLVTTEVVDNLYNDFYTKTEHGKEINDLSYIKYDSTIAESINEGTQSVVETGIAVGLSVLATPAAGAAFMGLVKGGEAVQKAYENGATYNEATIYGTIEAATNAGMWYVLGKSGEGIKALTSSAANFGRSASLKLLGGYALKNGVTVGVKPLIDALAEKATYNSETTLSDIFQQNNTVTQSLMGMSMAGLLTYIPGYFMIDKATTSLAVVETLGLPAATGATEATTYATLYNPEVAVKTVSAISAGSPELGLSVISNNGIANLTGGLVTTISSYLPTALPAALAGSIDALPKVISNIDSILEPVGSTIGGITPNGTETMVEVPIYKDYSKVISNVELATTDSPYLKLVTSNSMTPVTIEGAKVVYYDKLTGKINLIETVGEGTISEPGNIGAISEPTGIKSSIDNLIKQLELDKDYYETQVTDKDSFLISIKNMIKNYSRQYFEINDVSYKKEILKYLSRYYDLLYYINSTKDIRRMYLLDGDIESLPNIFVVDQKPTFFELDNNLLSSINIEQGLTEIQAEELLKWTANNTRNNLNISCQNKSGKFDVYDNNSLIGACGFSQFSTLYPLQKLGLTVTINNISTINNIRHAYGTVTIPINNNGTIVQKRYLIDCTYRQFFDIKSNVVSRYIGGNSPRAGFFVIQDDAEIEFAKELLKNGFVEASPENLEKYLKPFYSMSVNMENLGQIDENFSKLDIADVLDNHQEEFDDYTEEEFSDWGMNLDFNFGGIT